MNFSGFPFFSLFFSLPSFLLQAFHHYFLCKSNKPRTLLEEEGLSSARREVGGAGGGGEGRSRAARQQLLEGVFPPSPAQQVSPTCASLIATRPRPCVVTRNSNTRTLFK